MKDYIRYKVVSLVKMHISLSGDFYNDIGIKKPKVNYDNLVNCVSDLGDYKITWKSGVPTNIEKIPNEIDIHIDRGKYILTKSGVFISQLYSSEYIKFSTNELREFKLNKILKDK